MEVVFESGLGSRIGGSDGVWDDGNDGVRVQ